MSKKRTTASAGPPAPAPDPPKPDPNKRDASDVNLRAIGGSQNSQFNNQLADAVLATGWWPKGDDREGQNKIIFAIMVGMTAFKPTDEIEGMIAAQAVAMHHASMECSRRAMVPEQPFEVAQGLRKSAANMSRTFVELVAALDRKRGKGGQQKVTVEHVHVHAGGKAIVGAVEPGASTGGGGGYRRQNAG